MTTTGLSTALQVGYTTGDIEMRLENGKLKFSWNGVKNFLSCQRKAELRYKEGIELKDNPRLPLLTGSAFHEGMAGFLKSGGTISVAREEINTYLGRQRYTGDDLDRKLEVDLMLDEAYHTAISMIETYTPLLEMGERYFPVEVETSFELDCVTYVFEGRIDAVLYDSVEDKKVLVDWKTTSSLKHPEDIALDNQLHFYALAYKDVDSVIYHQFRTKLPQPARITKTGKLSEANQATTWDVWYSTLPDTYRKQVDKDIDKWKVWAEEKLNPLSNFYSKHEYTVDERSRELTKQNLDSIAISMKDAVYNLNNGHSLPAILSMDKCQFCDYRRLCSGVLRYGGDPAPIIEEFYQPIEYEDVE